MRFLFYVLFGCCIGWVRISGLGGFVIGDGFLEEWELDFFG